MKGLFIFLSGAILGSAITFILMKNYYDPEDYDEEGECDYGEPESANPEVTQNNIIEENGYVQYSTTKKEERKEDDDMDKPYIITPEEFSDSDYKSETLTYWADGVVTDIDDEPLSDDQIEELIGEESLKHFGEYEDDSVFVRNDGLRVDYEILADTRNYGEVYDE